MRQQLPSAQPGVWGVVDLQPPNAIGRKRAGVGQREHSGRAVAVQEAHTACRPRCTGDKPPPDLPAKWLRRHGWLCLGARLKSIRLGAEMDPGRRAARKLNGWSES